MRSWLRYFASLILFWLLYFLVQRTLFLVTAGRALREASWSEILMCNVHALPLDLSTTGYILLVVSLLAGVLLFVERSWARTAVRWFLYLAVFLSAFIAVSDIALFGAWGSKIDRKALAYLAWPREAIAGITLGLFLAFLAITGVLTALGVRALKRIDHQRSFLVRPRIAAVVVSLLTPILFFIMARGGPQDDPINKSASFYSRHRALNLGALNGMWNLLEIAVTPEDLGKNPYEHFPRSEAEAVFTASHRTTSSPALKLSRTERPNILVILLESWSGDVIGSLGGETDVAPQFDRLAREGLLFTNFYSTGFRTEQGLCAVLSGFPAQPTTTIMRNFGKFDRLPSLVRNMNALGYSSVYWYSGNVTFANTRTYLETMGFDQVHDEKSFEARTRTRWGALDEELFAFHLKHVSERSTPFFDVLMTATSHEPFNAPVNEGFKGKDPPQRYRNTVHYTDRALGEFIAQAHAQPWYDNTLILIMPDHGHFLPLNRTSYERARHHIPLLITGGALKDELRGQRDATFGCHTDLPATLLAQMGAAHAEFEWSRDLFDPTLPHRAFWTFNEGFGMADSVQAVVYDEGSKHVIELGDSSRTADRDRLLREGQVNIQVLLERFIEFDQPTRP
jgi:phosphoglycerol transferase MdoB-like AlkP superfamily enzyme